MFSGRRVAPTSLRPGPEARAFARHKQSTGLFVSGLSASVPRPLRGTRFVRFAHYAQTPAMSQFTIALRAGPQALRFSAPLVRAASKPSPPLRQQCLRATVARRHGAGLRQSGGPRSEVKGENWAQPSSEDMSGGGHPADVAQGQRKHAEASEKNFRNRREPNDHNGPKAAERNGMDWQTPPFRQITVVRFGCSETALRARRRAPE